jgi:hypothetical protein
LILSAGKTLVCDEARNFGYTGFTIMLWWHTRIAEARLQDRLEHLDLPAVKVYVAGCVTHARDGLTKALVQGPSNEFIGISQVLDRFWLQYPSSLQAPLRDLLITEAATFLPGEGGKLDWEDAIIWATAYVLAVVRRDQYTPDAAQEALEALHQAYWSVFSYNHGQGQAYPSDEDIQRVEKNSPVCIAEIEFQLAFLAALEVCQGQPPPYATLLQQMGGGN